jgi:hypothetical protein
LNLSLGYWLSSVNANGIALAILYRLPPAWLVLYKATLIPCLSILLPPRIPVTMPGAISNMARLSSYNLFLQNFRPHPG